MAGTSGTTTICPSPVAAARPPRWPRWLPGGLRLGCRFVLAGAFLAAAVSKITDLEGFRNLLLLHARLPEGVSTLIAAWLPWLELTCAACLLFGRAVREAALLLDVLLLGFIAYQLIHHDQPDCGCFIFPSISKAGLAWHLVLDLVLLACGLVVLLARPRPIRPDVATPQG